MKYGRVLVLLGMIFGVCFAQGSLAALSDSVEEEMQARELLARAVEYYQEHRAQALPVFSRQGPFVRGNHYVFVIDAQGVMLASGGASAGLIGKNVMGYLPDDLKVFSDVLHVSEGQGVQQAEYRWMNWVIGREERKKVFFQRVGGVLLATGYLITKATPAHAREMLERAADAVETVPEQTFAAINSESLIFLQDDLYVFVVDLRSYRYVAHGYNQRLVGTDFRRVNDPQGKPVGMPMLKAAEKSSQGEYDYLWENPLSRRVEPKHTYFRRVGDYLVSVGYYGNSTD